VKQGEAARRPPHTESVTLTDDPPSLTERLFSARVDHRQRQIQRLATIALTRALYGSDLGRLMPPGPAVCSSSCPWCGQREAVAS
jgi:hypothetical protein